MGGGKYRICRMKRLFHKASGREASEQLGMAKLMRYLTRNKASRGIAGKVRGQNQLLLKASHACDRILLAVIRAIIRLFNFCHLQAQSYASLT